ncbi:MAG: HlyD family secretion protein [Deltaproteobacteria bacterium]|nr:HlyD family secretion protein [Deltaproteobacteria bacterium]
MTDSTTPETPVEPAEKPAMTTGKKIFLVLFLILLIVFAGIAAKWLHYRFTHAITDNAFVESDMINVAPLVSGHIRTIFVEEGDRVKKGQLLLKIDSTDYENGVALQEANTEAAEMNLKQSRAALENLRVASRESIRKAKSGLLAAGAEGDRMQKDYDRISQLLKKGAVSQSRYDAVKAAWIATRAKVVAAEADLKQAQASKFRVREAVSAVNAARSAVKAAREALKVAQTRLGYTRVKSPIAGVVAKKFLNEGDFLAAGYPVLSLYNKENIYVTANLEETKTDGVRVGQKVDLAVDTYSDRTFHGRVILIGEAAGAKFALIPRDNSAGEFTKVVQRIPIRISVDKGRELLKPGMSVTVGIALDGDDRSPVADKE